MKNEIFVNFCSFFESRRTTSSWWCYFLVGFVFSESKYIRIVGSQPQHSVQSFMGLGNFSFSTRSLLGEIFVEEICQFCGDYRTWSRYSRPHRIWTFITVHDAWEVPKRAARLDFLSVGESRQPWAIFQLTFFLGKQTIKNQKTNIV